MTKTGANRPIMVKSDKCHGCLTCQLRCSLRAVGKFSPPKAHIKVMRSEIGYKYQHAFTEDCDLCGGDYLCVRWCPYGALGLERNNDGI